MAIYIKGMEMPKNCDECRCICSRWNGKEMLWRCGLSVDTNYIFHRRDLYDECPLTEVQEPHGRLVDMDKALEVIALEYGYDGIEDDMEYKVPTIIERSDNE